MVASTPIFSIAACAFSAAAAEPEAAEALAPAASALLSAAVALPAAALAELAALVSLALAAFSLALAAFSLAFAASAAACAAVVSSWMVSMMLSICFCSCSAWLGVGSVLSPALSSIGASFTHRVSLRLRLRLPSIYPSMTKVISPDSVIASPGMGIIYIRVLRLISSSTSVVSTRFTGLPISAFQNVTVFA